MGATMKYRDLIKQIENDGWHFLRMKGSHGQFKHPTKPGLVTIVVKPGKDVPIGTLKSILRQAGLE
jgi:predicted RNA binding protein YcfA (HicA-like mRNA interferase family)